MGKMDISLYQNNMSLRSESSAVIANYYDEESKETVDTPSPLRNLYLFINTRLETGLRSIHFVILIVT